MKQETVSTHSNLKTTKQLQVYFRTYNFVTIIKTLN